MAINDFPAALQGVIQQNFLNREFEEGLDSILAYRLCAIPESIPARIGEQLTRTRKGRMAPTTIPLVPANVAANIDNSLTPGSFTMEQYTYFVNEYAQTVDVDLLGEMVGVADQMIAFSRNNGVAAAQSLERIAKYSLFAAYNTGNSWITKGSTPTTTSIHLDDIRGFQNVLVNGVVTPVSAANPLTVNEIATVSGGVNQTLTVTAAVADATNTSIFPASVSAQGSDGVSGTLTINTAGTTPVAGDAIVAVSAPKVFRPQGKNSTIQLASGDTLTLSLVLDAVAYLRDNGVPPFPQTGAYRCILDNSSMRALFADQDFKVLFAGRDASSEYRSADIVHLLGVEFIPTTEAYFQSANTSAGLNVNVRRPIVIGAESLLQGNFEGLDMWLNRDGFNAIGVVMMVNDVAQIVRPPLDRMQRTLSMTWTWVGGFAVPTDLTATTDIIPTASNALYKRALVLEHAA